MAVSLLSRGHGPGSAGLPETKVGSTDFRTLYILTDCCSAFVTYCPSRSINQISNKAKTSIFNTSLNIVLIREKTRILLI